MKCIQFIQWGLATVLLAPLGFGCASSEPALPPVKLPPPASSPAEIERALPGTWVIDVEASADALARAQFVARQVATLRRDSAARETPETITMTERFDATAYREARSYWLDLLQQPDMKWRLKFLPDGTGEQWAIVTTGQAPDKTAFTWRLDGWRLHLDYAGSTRFRNFEVTMTSAVELHYPMAPLGDHLVLRPGKDAGSR